MTNDAEQLKVLIVDDSEEVRSALAPIIDAQPDLALLGAAAGVDEGLGLARDLHPDVVVLDVNMPEGGGLRAARELTAAVPGVRIVAYSAFDKALIRKTMEVAGAAAYVSKSANIRELLDAIRATSEPHAPESSRPEMSGVPWSRA